jgi:hypothetical protein
MRKALVAIVAALALSPLAARAQAYPYAPYSGPHRSPWYVGFGIGTGTGSIYLSGGQTLSFHDAITGITPNTGLPIDGTSDNGRIGFNFKFGATLTPQFLLGFDFTLLRGWGSVNSGGLSYDTWVQVWNGDVMATFFPFERGLFFRAGTGLSVLSVGISPGTFAVADTFEHGGVNATIGAGYAFWLARHFNLTLGLDLSRQWYGSNTDGVEGSGMFLAYMGFDWY